MALNFVATESKDLTPRITVFGVGGAGGNAVNNMIEKNLEGVEFVVANTDAQALQQSKARSRIQMGIRVTEGLGAGARPEVGASAAEETLEEIVDHLAGAHMCFITAGMGGGTGTGAAPIIAQAARDLGVLTVGVVTKPFSFEGNKRLRAAEAGVEALQKVVDTLIVIPNQNLFRLANERTTCAEAFAMADDVLYQGVKGVTDLMVRPGMINLDFADVRAVMDEMGKAMMGTGEASGEDRAREAAEKAIANPLLDEISLNGARGVLINITGGHDLTLYELDEAANLIREKVDPDANIIVGSTLDPSMEGSIRVSVVATGIEAQADAQTLDVQRRRLETPLQSHAAPAPVVEQTYAPEPAYQPQYEPEVEESVAMFDDHSIEQDLEPALGEMPAAYRPAPQRQAYAQQTARQHEPVQDEFDLDDILGAEANTPRPIVRVMAPAQPQMTPQRQAPAPTPVQQPSMSAPTPPRRVPGQPTEDVLKRLASAVHKVPENAGQRAEQARAPQRPAAPHPQPQAHQERHSRLGGAIGGILGRLGAREEHPAPQQAAAPRQQPRMAAPQQALYDDETDRHNSQDRIEIPAFLRRQAN